MKIIRTIQEMKSEVKRLKREGGSLGFIPTMGALHEGHTSLFQRSADENDYTAASIFVNPLQFGPNEDLDAYPRSEQGDIAAADKHGVDLLFIPSVQEMYPRPMTTVIHVKNGADVLCGKSRPGHFDGVATVVNKLLHIVPADRAYFGRKDIQAAAVLTNMISDYHLDTELVICDTVREASGLAKSSRNVYLSDSEKQEAAHIYKALTRAKALWEKGERPQETVEVVKEHLNNSTTGRIDYVEALPFPSLDPLDTTSNMWVIACAVYFNKARLIDNITVTAVSSYDQTGKKEKSHV
ncbi:pantoate--beta-alanine ligase [Sinobaca sp. H24]|uniref:pantoate--beta-alanine ligase n=1 Tax=Sinobaca sp. H24 TaxID=2923376 RepID=UPI00207A0BDC|nr:pantoate--beta-alanine ligase [Sinobaca sp. H24]